jgi:hypothetical protein
MVPPPRALVIGPSLHPLQPLAQPVALLDQLLARSPGMVTGGGAVCAGVLIARPAPLGEPVHTPRVQHLVGGAQLLARVRAASWRPRPL